MSVQCSTDVGFYQVRLPPPSTSQFLRQIDSDHPWSEARLSSLKVADFMLISKWICCYLVYWLPIAKELRLQLSNICYTCRAYILPSCCILQELPLYISGNGSMERCGYQRWHWGFKTAPASQGFNKVMTVDTMGRSPNFSIAGWSRANLLATPRHSVMFFLEKSTWIRFI